MNQVAATSNFITLNVFPVPAKPAISQSVGNLISSSVSGNQWFNQSNPVSGAINQVYRPVSNGNYQVQVTQNGCLSPLSDPFTLNIEGINKLYPVPTNGRVTFDFFIPEGSGQYRVEVFNSIGQLVHQEEGSGQPGLNRINYQWEKLAAAIYTFRMTLGGTQYKKRLLVQ